MKVIIASLLALTFSQTASGDKNDKILEFSKYSTEKQEYWGNGGFLKACGQNPDQQKIEIYDPKNTPAAEVEQAGPPAFKSITLIGKTCEQVAVAIDSAIAKNGKLKLVYNLDKKELLSMEEITPTVAPETLIKPRRKSRK